MPHRTDKPYGVAIVGAGERGVYCLGRQMVDLFDEVGLVVRTVFDRLDERARLSAADLERWYAERGQPQTVPVASSLEQAVTDPAVDLVLVTTFTGEHVEPVERAVAAGKLVYLDKPISVTLEDALAIEAAQARARRPVIMGFTRRYEEPWIETARQVASGGIGSCQMLLLRSVIPYHRYLQRWHRVDALSGGALNDKSSHHFDALNWIAGGRCRTVSAIGGRSGIFAPDPTAPTRCRDCDRDCPYRSRSGLIAQAEGFAEPPNASWTTADSVEAADDACVYHSATEIEDHAIVTLAYDNGVKASLFFTIFGPFAPDQETLEVVGSSGRLRMERSSGRIDLIREHGHRHEEIAFNDPERATSHYGADRRLVRDLRAFCDGAEPTVGVSEGIASLRLVLAARQSIRARGRPIDPFDLAPEPEMEAQR